MRCRSEQKCAILSREVDDMKATYEDMLAAARKQHDDAIAASRAEMDRRLEEARRLHQVTVDKLAKAKVIQRFLFMR